jgi:ribonuclease HI
METFILYTDGGSRGNPGPAALGVYLETLGKEYGEFLGEKTNNEAEYMAIISGLKKMKALLGKARAKASRLECRMDSELAMKQLTHQYKVEKEHIQKLCFEVWNLALDFGRVDFVHVPREQNKVADRMVNDALDRALGQKAFL